MASKPIFALSLIGGAITFCVGKVVGEEIHFIKLEKIGGRFGRWKKTAIEELEAAQKKGWHILVDDMTDQFTEYGLTVDLGAIDPIDGRTLQNIALDQYMAMANLGIEESFKAGKNTVQAIGALAFVGSVGNFAIRPNAAKINIEYDDKGRPRYDIDGGLNSGERAMLMVVLAAKGMVVKDTDYAKNLFAAIESEMEVTFGRADQNKDINSTIRTMLSRSSSSSFAKNIHE